MKSGREQGDTQGVPLPTEDEMDKPKPKISYTVEAHDLDSDKDPICLCVCDSLKEAREYCRESGGGFIYKWLTDAEYEFIEYRFN